MDLIVSYLQQFGSGAKSDFIKLLGDKLSDVLDDKQKDRKVNNLLISMSRKELIYFDNKTSVLAHGNQLKTQRYGFLVNCKLITLIPQ